MCKSYHNQWYMKANIKASQGIKWEAWNSIHLIKRNSDFCESYGTTTCPLICIFCFYQYRPCFLNLSQLLFLKKLTSGKHSGLPLVMTRYWIYSLDNLFQFSEQEHIPEGHWFEAIIFPIFPNSLFILCLTNLFQARVLLKELSLFSTIILRSLLNILPVIAWILNLGFLQWPQSAF